MTWWQHWVVGQVDASMAAVALLALATLARRRLSPNIRSAILLIALARLALPPWVRSPWSEAAADIPPVDGSRALVAGLVRLDGVEAIAALTTVVTLLVIARLVWHSLTLTRRWLRSTAAAPIDLQRRVDALAAEAGFERPVRVRLSATDGPLATGLWTPLIVLPLLSVDQLARGAMDAVLAHEVAHHARRDLYWSIASSVLLAIVWFNPLSHLIARALSATREDGSDDWAVSHTSRDPHAYAHALLQSARLATANAGWRPSPLESGAHPMGKRLKRLLEGGAAQNRRVGPLAIALVVVLAGLSLPGAHMPRVPAFDQDDERIVIRQVIPVRHDVTTITQKP